MIPSSRQAGTSRAAQSIGIWDSGRFVHGLKGNGNHQLKGFEIHPTLTMAKVKVKIQQSFGGLFEGSKELFIAARGDFDRPSGSGFVRRMYIQNIPERPDRLRPRGDQYINKHRGEH